jgi:integral membrane sensor domain MASE1
LIERFVAGEFSLDKLRHVLWLLAAAIIGATTSGFASAVGVKLFHGSATSVAITWWHWFSSNVVGIITTAPLIIGIVSLVRVPPPRGEVIEGTAALIAVVAVMGTIIFLLPQVSIELLLSAAVVDFGSLPGGLHFRCGVPHLPDTRRRVYI